ncbi:hypothetical protein [Pseudobacteriovorax antillogorgiicola]|uniref:Astacin (Peptidase family M12A) n=1 Tax=Pseudobacteriovorax antillogorgiicola TaxID=1513793 RepID=A0A1Y6CEY3_9BACT|nr:hypothetical protein [Pseudobacteriovorax antillogorgiicola]TCS47615.1 hypothetical protein EDD56_12056 [Pseudobacteriovorax antillogorgiicola]SMF60054.1 hypothetical protein SAMN06296036_12084 [Pseudobacteriovorax antillogorgiicola]
MKYLSLLTASVLMVGCGATKHKGHSALDSVADLSAVWSDPGPIPVCFVDTRADWQQYRDLVKDNVTSNYNRTKHIRFSGWGFCPQRSSEPTIRIKLGNPIPMGNGSVMGCSHIGPGPDSYNVCESLLSNYNGNGFNMYIFPLSEGTDVHEFGHALGIRHEHARTDAPTRCSTGEIAHHGGNIFYITEDYDSESVMGYCNGTSELSAGDIAGLDALYDWARQ